MPVLNRSCINYLQYSDSIKVIRGIVILDEEGHAITKKYYTNDFPTAETQDSFEQKIFKKFKPEENKEDSIISGYILKIATIGLLDKFVVIGKAGRDCSIFVYGSDDENEMIMIAAMDGFFEALKILLKQERKQLFIYQG